MAEFETEMKKRFHIVMTAHKELSEKPERVAARERYDVIAKEISALLAKQKIEREIFEPIERQMSELSNEGAALARALKGQTGLAEDFIERV